MNSFEFKMSIKLNDKTIKEMQEFEIKKFYKAMSDIGSKNILRTLRSHIKEYEKQEKQERSR